jgi:hypothetical protein
MTSQFAISSPVVAWLRSPKIDTPLLPYSCPYGLATVSHLTRQSQSHFTNCQPPWAHDQTFFNWTLTVVVLMQRPLWREEGFVSYEYAWLLSSLGIAHIVRMLLKILPCALYKVLCQSCFWKEHHAYLTYLMLQRQLSHLNGRKIHHRQV